MEIQPESYLSMVQKREEAHVERIREVAHGFEKLFAQQLVQEMTKDSFSLADNPLGSGGSASQVRHLLVDTLAETLASERQLGMARMVEHFWSEHPSLNPSQTEEGEE